MAMAAITLTKRIKYRYAKSILEDVVFDVAALLMSGSENFKSISEAAAKREAQSVLPSPSLHASVPRKLNLRTWQAPDS